MNRHAGDSSFWKTVLTHRCLLVMFLIPAVFVIVFNYLPMVGAIIAFKEFRMSEGVFGSTWSGFANFASLFTGTDFLRALRNTVIISFLRLTTGFFAPVILALMLNEVRLQCFKRTVQSLTYIPFFFSWVILGGIFKLLFAIDGPVNAVLTACGGDAIQFMADKTWFVVVLIVTGIWQGLGYGAVIYLAALAGISPTLYEAARVDGAGRWQQMLHITLPSLVPTMVVLFILGLGQFLSAGFDQIYNMYNPLVYETTDIIDTYVLRRMVAMDYSLVTAAGLFKGVIGMMLIVGANRLANRYSGGEQGIW
jgi:putative aldouronate transport system permease protein